jgi:hypothetical protein
MYENAGIVTTGVITIRLETMVTTTMGMLLKLTISEEGGLRK